MIPGYVKVNEEQKLKIIEDELINSINPSWNKDEIIRYVYLYIGKYISKNVGFFYSLGRKLDNKIMIIKKSKVLMKVNKYVIYLLYVNQQQLYYKEYIKN